MTDSELPAIPDEMLLPAIAGGDAAAFAELFRRRHRAIYRFALHMTGSPAAADDITQDVFVAVLRDAARYDAGRSTAAAWLCGIARNMARRRLAAEQAVQPLTEMHEREPEGPAVEAQLDDLTRAEGIEMVRRAVLSLPLQYREAIVMCDLQELSYAEAAAALGCAVGTVRSRLHRGRALLGSKLSADRESTTGVKAAATRCFA